MIKWAALYYTYGTCGINCEVAQNFRVSLDEKREKQFKTAERENTIT